MTALDWLAAHRWMDVPLTLVIVVALLYLLSRAIHWIETH
jgi:hypothetical protein